MFNRHRTEPSHRLSDEQAVLVELLFELPKAFDKSLELLSEGEVDGYYRLRATDYNPTPHIDFWEAVFQTCLLNRHLSVTINGCTVIDGGRTALIRVQMVSAIQSIAVTSAA